MWRPWIFFALLMLPLGVSGALSVVAAVHTLRALGVPDLGDETLELRQDVHERPVWNGAGLMGLTPSREYYPVGQGQALCAVPTADVAPPDGATAEIALTSVTAHLLVFGASARGPRSVEGLDSWRDPRENLAAQLAELLSRNDDLGIGWTLIRPDTHATWDQLAVTLSVVHAHQWAKRGFGIGASRWPHGGELCISGRLQAADPSAGPLAQLRLSGGYLNYEPDGTVLLLDSPLSIKLAWGLHWWSIPVAQNYRRRGRGPSRADVYADANAQWNDVRKTLGRLRAAGSLPHRIELVVDARTPTGPLVKAVDLLVRHGVREFDFYAGPDDGRLTWAVDPVRRALPVPDPAVRPPPLAPWWVLGLTVAGLAAIAVLAVAGGKTGARNRRRAKPD